MLYEYNVQERKLAIAQKQHLDNQSIKNNVRGNFTVQCSCLKTNAFEIALAFILISKTSASSSYVFFVSSLIIIKVGYHLLANGVLNKMICISFNDIKF